MRRRSRGRIGVILTGELIINTNPHAARPRAGETILGGGIAAALLDIALAMTFWWFYSGASPWAILQSIAAGLLGKESFAGGMGTAALGAFLHVFIACVMAAVYYLGCLRWPVLYKKPVFCGAVYGVILYLAMSYIVLPLSKASPMPFIPSWFLASVLSHVVFVGIPIALVARWSAARSASS
ncbi:MAG: hypothetical protein WBO00_09880 [Steroidobacteraceae bacterium]